MSNAMQCVSVSGVIVLFYFIVCYLLNIVLFYSKYDVCSRKLSIN